ncbi:MAG: hypothetical protein IJP17_03135 [Clostridia bacterium]|nr:hypothetical protein [Clostridia bacterium]
MNPAIAPVLLGIFLSLLGIANMKGSITSIHWYHRHRVSAEDIKPFGRLVGAGTLTIGISIAIYGGLAFIADRLHSELYTIIGSVIVIIAIVIGLAVMFYAMIKYNKGIF